MLMVGQKFPELTMSAVMPDGTTDNQFKVGGKRDGYAVVFFYPLDFTFVCPTELVAFNQAISQFEERNVAVIGGSIDSTHSHAAWRRTPLKEGGIGDLKYPLISDMQRKLSGELGILNADGVTYRASYLLDKEGVIRHMVVNDLPLGRSVPEMLRMVDALAFFEENGEVCPANWHKGDEGMKTTREAVGEHFSKKAA
jgi:peroxiredoxin (alkyl hydroperoxide reductase subunit C)